MTNRALSQAPELILAEMTAGVDIGRCVPRIGLRSETTDPLARCFISW